MLLVHSPSSLAAALSLALASGACSTDRARPSPARAPATARARAEPDPVPEPEPEPEPAAVSVSAPLHASSSTPDADEPPPDHPMLEKPAPPRPREPPRADPEVHAVFLGARTITVDGLSDEPIWSAAEPAVYARDAEGRDTPFETRARFAWSKTALYAFFDVAYAGFHADASKPVTVERAALEKEDCVELVLVPDAKRPNRVLDVAVGPFGHFFDAALDRASGERDTSWSSGALVGTARDPLAHTVAIEVALTARDVTSALAPGARLSLGLFRFEGAVRRELLAWRTPRTAKPDVHAPDALGALVLDP
ncbi:MAG TPA: carbohydrate-binding family 9-like protein [Minicystis sp.]|nr:carbohydrate-binding family 9-like protein [Minicystis sp.]